MYSVVYDYIMIYIDANSHTRLYYNIEACMTIYTDTQYSMGVYITTQ